MKGTVLVRMPSDMKAWVEKMATDKGITSPEYIRSLISKERERLSIPKINPFVKQQERQVAYG